MLKQKKLAPDSTRLKRALARIPQTWILASDVSAPEGEHTIGTT
jgi:hypothetical protein